MPMTRVSPLTVSLMIALSGVTFAACSDDAAEGLNRGGRGASSSSSGGTGEDGNQVSEEERLFREAQADIEKKCGGTCHTEGTYKPTPPVFLAGPDPYKSIKGHPNMITPDPNASAFMNKGQHAGPAVDRNVDADFYKKVFDWLSAEAVAIQSIKLPTTPPFTVVSGPNDVDLSPACVGGMTNVHMKFDASIVGTTLSLSNIKVVAPAGSIGVHILQPKFVRVLAAPKDGLTEFADPADSFSNTDAFITAGTEDTLPPGSVFFAGATWRPYDMANDKIRIEAVKIEPGNPPTAIEVATCKNVPNFTANVLPSLRGQAGGFNLNCANCHGNGLAGLSLNGADQTVVCNQVLGKLNGANIAQSVMVTKVTVGPHSGGQINDAAGWTAVFANNRTVFF